MKIAAHNITTAEISSNDWQSPYHMVCSVAYSASGTWLNYLY